MTSTSGIISPTGKTSYIVRSSYAATDIAVQFMYCVVSFYLLKFYTDTYGISIAAAGTIMLVARCTDAFDAPFWGILFDKTNSRWGKSRPWLLWLSFPFAIFGLLTFMTPNLGTAAKMWYAGGTYVIWSVLSTGVGTAIGAILPALTPNPQERVTLVTFRMIGSKIGVLLVNLTLMRMVAWLGHGDDRKGFMLVLLIYATATILLFLFAFRNLKETVREEHKPQTIRGNFGAIKGNWPWIIIFISSFFFWIAFIARICTAPYFFEYTLHRKDLIPLANSLDFVSLATILALPFLCRWTSKRNVWIWGLLGMVIGQCVLGMGVHMGSLPVIFIGWVAGFLACGLALPIPFSLLADSVDYGEWKTGIRAPGLLIAIGGSLCIKAGSGLGSSIPAWGMAAHGYVPNVEQTVQSLKGIEMAFVWLPAVFLALSTVPVVFYKKYELLEPQIKAELDVRRAHATTIHISSPSHTKKPELPCLSKLST
jgi:sugar (glycoside-pentoside-hexuronide) transporter